MSCNPLPTQTLYRTDVLTTQSIGTSTVQSLITLPASSTTSTQSSCILSASNGTCQTYATTEVVVAIPGEIRTVEGYVPYTSVVVATDSIPTATLFAPCSETPSSSSSSYSSISSSTPGEITTSPTDTPNRPTTTKTITSSRTPIDPTPTRGSVSYGPPTTYITSVTVTLSNGRVSTEVSTGTSTPTLWVPAPSESSGSNVGLVVGSVVGGFAALSILAGIIWLLWRKRKVRWDDIFEEDNELERSNRRRMDLIDTEPKPYEYGMVGAQSPPGSPHLGSADRRASSAPLLAGSFSTSHSAAPSMDFQSYSSHTPYGSLSIPRQPTGGSSVHSRDNSYQYGPLAPMSGRDRMPYADEQGVFNPYMLAGSSATPATYPPPADRKVRPQTFQNNSGSPVLSPSLQLGLAASSSVSTSSNAGRLSPSSLISPVSNRAPSSQGFLSNAPRVGEGAEEPLPPPYSQNATSPSTVSAPSTFASTAQSSQRFGLANPDAGAGAKMSSSYR